jgi:uncharacterized protein (DUF2249 family)
MPDTEQELNVTKIPPQRKHAAIFETYNALEAGEAFVIINDHDPRPLRFQFAAQQGEDKFSWEYLQQGPDTWKVRIGKTG